MKGEGKGTGKKTTKKSNKAVAVVNSDSEDLEVDIPHHPTNQPHEVPADLPQEPNPPADVPVEDPQEPETQQTFLLRDEEKQGNNKNHTTLHMFQQKT